MHAINQATGYRQQTGSKGRLAIAWRCLWYAASCLLLAGCDLLVQERFQDYTQEGIFLFGKGEFQGARECFQEALILLPNDPNMLFNVAQCYDRQGDGKKAESYYRLSLEKKPDLVDARFALAMLIYRSGRRTEATQMIQDWMKEQPQMAEAFTLDGWRLRQESAYPQAQGRFQQALAIERNNPRALTELASLYEVVQRPDIALVLYERALDRDPRQPLLMQKVSQLRDRGVRPPLPD